MREKSITPLIIGGMIALVAFVAGYVPTEQLIFIILFCVGLAIFLWWDDRQ
jgi:hypothetical protein